MDAMISNAVNENDFEKLIVWFKSGFVHDMQGNKLESVEVSLKHKHELMKRIWASNN